jgi:RND superfamily putative drug exporter
MFSLSGLGRFVYRHRWFTLISAGAFLVVSLVSLLRGGDLTTGTITGIEADDARQLLQKVPGHPGPTTFLILFRSDHLSPTSVEFRDAMQKTAEPLRKNPHILTVQTPVDAPEQLADQMMNKERRTAFAIVTLAGDTKHALQNYTGIRAEIHSDVLAVDCTGEIPYIHDLDKTLEDDMQKAEVLSLPLSILILLAVFGTLVAAVLPAGIGGLSVVGGIAIVMFISRFSFADIAQYTVNVCSLIGLGVAIDYSLFIVSRYREEIANGYDYEEALVRAVATSGRVVLFSGLAVCTGLTGLLFFKHSYLWSMGLGGAIVVALAVVFALTFLPAVLAILGPRIQAGRVPIPPITMSPGFWHRMATAVMKYPLLTLIPTLTLLLVMGVPFFHIRLAGADVRVIARTVEARRAYEELKEAFPDKAKPRTLVVVEFPGPALTQPRIDALYDAARRIEKIPHVTKVESIVTLDQLAEGAPEISRQGYTELLLHPPPPEFTKLLDMAKGMYTSDGVAIMDVLLDVPPETDTARTVIKEIRSQREVGDGHLLVGGQTATDVDVTAYIWKLAPRAIGWVVGFTLLILFLLLGSVILPIKAVLMNFVSIAGAFGAIVWVFQDGHLGMTEEPRPLEPSLPVLLFCVVFGLSMDYEVLMLSRIKESYERTGDNTHSVAEGLEKTAGLITSAALIMVSVFGAFSLARVVQMKSMGCGMTLAVALDATLVRVLLVPAAMRLFGHLNWWAPSPLLRLRKMLNIRKRPPTQPPPPRDRRNAKGEDAAGTSAGHPTESDRPTLG